MPPDGFVHALTENPGKLLVDSFLGLCVLMGFWLFASGILILIWPTTGFDMVMWGVISSIVGWAGILGREKLK